MRSAMQVTERTISAILMLVSVALSGCGTNPSADLPLGPASLAKGGSGGSTAGSGKVSVKAADPDTILTDTTLVVTIAGSGFAPGASVRYLLASSPSQDVLTDSVEFVSSTTLRAVTTVAKDATPGAYDIEVMSNGKRGVGVEKIEVMDHELMALAVPSGTVRSGAADINDWHQIVGNTVANSVTQPGSYDRRGVYWPNADQGTLPVVLPCFTEPCWSNASQINASGVIVGFVDDAAVRWSPSGLTFAPDVLVDYGRAWGIRDDGVIVGEYDRDGRSREYPVPLIWNAAGDSTHLPIPAGYYAGVAQSINDQGDISGSLRYRPDGATGYYYVAGCLWVREGTGYVAKPVPQLVGGITNRAPDGSFRVASSEGRLRVQPTGGDPIVTLEAQMPYGNNLTNAGEMVGHVPTASYTSKGNPYLLRLSGEIVKLEAFPGTLGTATAVSSDLWVVGNLEVTAVVWKAR